MRVSSIVFLAGMSIIHSSQPNRSMEMEYEFIEPRDFETTPARYQEYLRDTFANAKRILSLPEQKWPKGSSHEISRLVMEECEIAATYNNVEFGLWSPETGKIVGYADA